MFSVTNSFSACTESKSWLVRHDASTCVALWAAFDKLPPAARAAVVPAFARSVNKNSQTHPKEGSHVYIEKSSARICVVRRLHPACVCPGRKRSQPVDSASRHHHR